MNFSSIYTGNSTLREEENSKLLKEIEVILNNSKKIAVSKKDICKYGNKCYQKNPNHLKRYSHPKDFKKCTDDYIRLSYKLYSINNNSFPDQFFNIIYNNLKESNFTDYTTLYFNILVNLATNAEEYIEKYPNKEFWSHLFIGMEETSVTGMYDITSDELKYIQKTLKNIGSVDTRYLSNTALLFSKVYGNINNNNSKNNSI